MIDGRMWFKGREMIRYIGFDQSVSDYPVPRRWMDTSTLFMPLFGFLDRSYRRPGFYLSPADLIPKEN